MATTYPDIIVNMAKVLADAQRRAAEPTILRKRRASLKGHQTRASKRFARICADRGYADAQAVMDDLVRKGVL